jgi:hypothetical protein
MPLFVQEYEAVIKKAVDNRIIFFSLAICLALFQVYVALSSPQVPYMDTMLFLVQIDQIIRGEISWFDVYGAGEHRGFIFPLVTAIEWGLWGVDAKVSTVLTGFVVTVIFYHWLKAFLLSQQESVNSSQKQVFIRVVIACLAAAVIASPAGFELWTLSLGFAQLLKNLLIVIFLYQLAIKKTWNKSVVGAVFYGVWGGVLILFATYGWSYPFLAASFFVLFATSLHGREYRKNAAVVFGIMLLAQLVYIYSGSGVFSNSSAVSAGGFPVAKIINGFFYGAGTTFIGGETIAKWTLPLGVPIAFGVILLIVCFFTLLITLMQQSSAKIFLCSMLVFALTVLAGVTLARGGVEFTNTGASRYFVDYVWLLLSPLAIIFTSHSFPLFSSQRYRFISLVKFLRLLKSIMAVLLIAAIIGHIATWSAELKTVPYRAATLEAMASVYRNGVQNNDDALLLQSPYSVAKRGVEVAQRYELAVLRHDEPRCTLKNATYRGDWYAPDNEGDDARWMRKQGVIGLSKCAAIVTIKGYLPDNFSRRTLNIAYGNKQDVISIEPGKEFSLRLDQMNLKRTTVTLQLDQVTSPLQAGIGADERELGLLLTYIGE